jgi:uncharacterized protein YbcI
MGTTMSSTPTSEQVRGPLAISNAITRLHREHYGRGPTSARTIIQRNYIICFLDDIFTPAERTLIDGGRLDTVRLTRQSVHDVTAPKFVAAVEQITGRHVIAFMSQIDFNPDVAALVFVVDPQGDDRAAEYT